MNNLSLSWWLAEAIKDNKSSQMCVTGGYGSQKSYSGWQWLLERVRQNPDCPTFFNTQPVHHLIRSASIKTFEAIADTYRLKEGKDYSINRSSPAFIKLHNKKEQEILLLSVDNPDVLVAFSSGFGLADEIALCKEEAYRKLPARNRYNLGNGKINQILYTTTPEGLGWFSDIWNSDVLDGWDRSRSRDHIKTYIEAYTKQTMQIRRFRALTKENPFNPPEYIANLYDTYAHNPNMVKSYLDGYFAPFATGLAVPNYNPALHDLRDEVKADPKNTLLMSWDWNSNPVSWVALTTAKNEFRKTEYILHEESSLGYSLIDDACLEFAVKFPVVDYGGTEILIYGDPAGFNKSWKTPLNDFAKVKSVLNKLGYKNVHIKAVHRPIPETETLDAINRAFYDNCVFINNHCIEIKKSLMQTKLKDNERKIDKPSGEKHTHKLDALKYVIYQVQQKENRTTQGEVKGFTI